MEKRGLYTSKLINQTLNIYYKKWSNFIGRFGINLEVHKQSLNEMKNNLDLNEGFTLIYTIFIKAKSLQGKDAILLYDQQ